MSRHRKTSRISRGQRAFTKDTLRTIVHSKKRFVSLVAICALGATMLTGLSMACIDLRAAADALYARQHLFDISVQSTLGLVQDDLDELAAVDGVEAVEGGYEQETYTRVNGLRATVAAKALLGSGINEPYLVEGKLPDSAGEIAVTENYLHEAGKSIGDTLEIESTPQEDPTGLSDLDTGGNDDGADAADEEGDPVIAGGTYTIVGTVIDPANITQPEGPIAFRAATSSDYTFFVDQSAVVDPATYTVAYLTVSGTEELSAYSAAYEERVAAVQDRVEDLAPQRERARTESIKADAYAEIDEAEADAAEQIADAEQELTDGQQELDESLAEVLRGQRELDTQRTDALSQLSDAQATIDANRVTLAESLQQLADGQRQLEEGWKQYNDMLPGITAKLEAGEQKLEDEKEKFEIETLGPLEEQRAAAQTAIDTLPGQISALDQQVENFSTGLSTLASMPELTVMPDASTVIQGLADRISETWTSVQNATQDEADAAAADFSQAMDIAASRMEDSILPIIESHISSLTSDLETYEEQLGEYDEELEGYAATIKTTQQDLDDLNEQLKNLSPDDPSYSELEEKVKQAELTISDTKKKQELTQGQRDSLAEQQKTAQEKLDGLKQQQTNILGIIALGDPETASNLASGRIQMAAGLAEAEAGLPQLEAAIEYAQSEANKEFDKAQKDIDNGWDELEAGRDALEENQQKLDESRQLLSSGQRDLAAGQAELDEQRADALAQLADAQDQLDDALEQIADGQAELDDGRATLEEERADAAEQIADARDQVDAVEQPTWYVQDRSSLGSFSSIDSDASSIEAIARIIPVIFFVVAILVSLTTATRMVEEERVLIGLYKALGYSKTRILSKYLVYSVSAALVGGIIGDIAGFVVIPYILLYIFQAMYLLPLFSLNFNLFFAVLGIAAFVIGIGGSTFLSCRAELAETPAILMRPKAPRAGSRIFLEYIGPVWRRMSFLNKVTARNLFRYKKRLFMTIFGIMGCTALLICGFSIKNTVESLAPRQYEQIYRYDLMAAVMPEDYETCYKMLEEAPEVTSIESIGVDNVTVEYNGGKESMQLYIIPTGTSIDPYVSLETLDGTPIDLDDAGVVITNNAATVLGLGAGDTIQITITALDEATPTVSAVTRNYLGNAVYMTEDVYEELFGPLELNGFFAHLDGSNDEQRAFADTLEDDEEFLSITSVAKMHDQFEQSFTLINVVVYVVIGLAAGLAFVVLFTLSTVNIGEREREIATIKVLGFRKREVRTYINKETFVLTGLGILVGMPAGWALSMSFTYILKMPSIYFDVVVAPWCYALAAAFSIVFALAVSLITNRMLDRVIMVEALKSPE